MSRISVHELTQAVLTGLGEPVEVCDEAGKVLGRYIPDRSRRRSQAVRGGPALVRLRRGAEGPSHGDRKVEVVVRTEVRQRLSDLEQSSMRFQVDLLGTASR